MAEEERFFAARSLFTRSEILWNSLELSHSVCVRLLSLSLWSRNEGTPSLVLNMRKSSARRLILSRDLPQQPEGSNDPCAYGYANADEVYLPARMIHIAGYGGEDASTVRSNNVEDHVLKH